MGGFLADRRHPKAELALALKGGGLRIETAHDGHIAIELLDVVEAELLNVLAVLGIFSRHTELALGAEQLHHRNARRIGGSHLNQITC